MFNPTRRRFLLAAGGAAAAAAGTALLQAQPNVLIDGQLAALMEAGHFSPNLGVMVLLQPSWKERNGIDSLHMAVMGSLQGDAPDLLAQIHQQIQQDFTRGDLCEVDGWVLSRTECRLAALAYLFQKAGGRMEAPVAEGPLDGLRETTLATVERWGPKVAEVGEAFKMQPNGYSALWFNLALHKQGAYVVYVGSEAGRTTISALGNTASAAFSKQQTASLLSQAGIVEVHLVDQVRGEKQLVGAIRVLPGSRSTETDGAH